MEKIMILQLKNKEIADLVMQ